jgi:Ca2+-binding EF-hand superfamily protein
MPKPIKRARFEQIVTDMFRAADTNRDGTVTIGELHAIVAARRAVIIKNRFATIDTDRNGAISMAEFTAWQDRMGSVANDEAAATGDTGAPISDAIMPDVGNERALAELIEPLTGTVIGSANTNYDAGLSLAELLAYEDKLFDAADTDHDGYLWPQDLRARDQNGGGRMHHPGGPMGAPPPR